MQSSLFRAARTVPNRVAASHARFFNIHEYQGKILCDRYGVPVQKWRAASTPEEAAAGAESLGECPPPNWGQTIELSGLLSSPLPQS